MQARRQTRIRITSVTRGGRLIAPVIAAKPSDRAIMEVSTVVHDGEKEVVRRQPFSHVKMMLAANHVATEDYPDFDPLAIFSADEPQPAPQSRTGAIYGSDVEIRSGAEDHSLPNQQIRPQLAAGLSLDEVEENVRSNGSVLTDGNAQLAALYYVDPRRFSAEDNDVDLTAGLAARVLEQNMTVSAPESITPQTEEFADDILPVRQDTTIAKALADSGYPQPQARRHVRLYRSPVRHRYAFEGRRPAHRYHSEGRAGEDHPRQHLSRYTPSDYRRARRQGPFRGRQRNRRCWMRSPPPSRTIPSPPPAGQNLPRVYDGIYRAALSYGMTKDMTALIIKLLASNVDFQAQLKPTDYAWKPSSPSTDSNGQATEDSDLLYVNARFGDTLTRFYRFQDPEDGTIDYFDQDGKSIRQFLLRNPVPNGIFKSGFGMRRHPILGLRACIQASTGRPPRHGDHCGRQRYG